MPPSDTGKPCDERASMRLTRTRTHTAISHLYVKWSHSACRFVTFFTPQNISNTSIFPCQYTRIYFILFNDFLASRCLQIPHFKWVFSYLTFFYILIVTIARIVYEAWGLHTLVDSILRFAFVLFYKPHSSVTGFCVPPCGSSPPSPSILHCYPPSRRRGRSNLPAAWPCPGRGSSTCGWEQVPSHKMPSSASPRGAGA